MEGRFTSTRALTGLVGLAAAIGIAAPANAETPETNRTTFETFGSDDSSQSRLFRTLDEAMASGLFAPVDNVEAFAGAQRGGANECNLAAVCSQPPDGVSGFNSNFLSLAESRTFPAAGTINELCASFIYTDAVFNGCPDDPTDPIFGADWQVRIYDVDAMGEIDESSVTIYDTELPTDNLAVVNANGGLFAGFAPIVDMQFDLTNGGVNPGFAVNPGDCRAIQFRPLQFGTGGDITCSMFWETSSDPVDGSVTGDDIVASDQTSTNDWTFCDYANGDLMLCMDYIGDIAPACSPDFSMVPSNDECDNPMMLTCSPNAMTPAVSQCLRFATVNTMTDPVLDDCSTTGGLDPNFQGLSTVWYELTTNPGQSRLLLDLCNTPGQPNFFLALYQVDPMMGEGPCSLVQVACNDNGCQASPFICLNDVNENETFILEVAAASAFDQVVAELVVLCDNGTIPFPEPANDDVNSPEPIVLDMAGQGTISGSTRCAGFDPISQACEAPDGDLITTGTGPGVWFSFVGDGTTWLFSQCVGGSGDYDTALSIYCGSGTTGITCITAQDEGGDCDPQTELAVCTEMGRPYLAYVHGEFDTGNFVFSVQSDFDGMGGCTNDPEHVDICVSFDLDCAMFFGGEPDVREETDAGSMMEMCEDDDINNGCLAGATDIDPNGIFIDGGAAPFTGCGQIDTGNNLRDLDAWSFTLDRRAVVTITMTAEFPPAFFLSAGTDCTDTNGNGIFGDEQVTLGTAIGLAGTAAPAVEVATLNPGSYEILVTIDGFSGAPCGSGINEYALEVTVAEIGRCCFAADPSCDAVNANDCCITTEQECVDLGGVFDADADCSPITYAKSDLGVIGGGFFSIIGRPNNHIIDGVDDDVDMPSGDPFGDDDAEFVDIFGEGPDDDPDTPEDEGDGSELVNDATGLQASIPFCFFGEFQDDIAVVSNGYVGFDTPVFLDATPDEIPTAIPDGALNNFAAGLWRDLDPSTGGNIEIAVFGTAPLRTIVIEYNDIALFGDASTSNTFQIQLFECTDSVVYAYNNIELVTDVFQDTDADPMTPDVPVLVVGVENELGNAGTSLDEAERLSLDTSGFSGTDARIISFVPSAELAPDVACMTMAVCPGDCDDNGMVNFSDLVAMLGEFGTPGSNPGCDADDSGMVNFSDLVAALGLFGPCP